MRRTPSRAFSRPENGDAESRDDRAGRNAEGGLQHAQMQYIRHEQRGPEQHHCETHVVSEQPHRADSVPAGGEQAGWNHRVWMAHRVQEEGDRQHGAGAQHRPDHVCWPGRGLDQARAHQPHRAEHRGASQGPSNGRPSARVIARQDGDARQNGRDDDRGVDQGESSAS